MTTEVNKNSGDESTEVFNFLSFERKLVELVEELRLRRDLENEGEKTLKSIMDEKYEEELSWEKQQRRHSREKEDLGQQIELLKRKLEDKVCVSDDDKAKQQIMNRTYSHEIRMLKEDLRTSKSEKLHLQKKIQELEGQLKLHNTFQDSIMTQMSDIRKTIKSVMDESQQLAASQKSVMENVASAKAVFRKYDLCNQHLQQSLSIAGKKNEVFKKELISARSELLLLKQSAKATEEEKPKHDKEVEKLQQKILDLENLFLLSRKENEKTHSNFLESNNLLCKLTDTFSEALERERRLTHKLESLQDKLSATEKKLRETEDKMRNNEEMAVLKEKARIENQVSTEVQTENNFEDRRLLPSRRVFENGLAPPPPAFSSPEPGGMCQDFMDKIRNGLMDLQQSAVVMQSESYVKNPDQDRSGDKMITVSEILKRKLEFLDSGDSIELISMKKRFSQDKTMQPSCNINTDQKEGFQNGVQISEVENNIQTMHNFNTGQNEGFQYGVQILPERDSALQFCNTGQKEGFQNGVQISAEENNTQPLYSINTCQNGVQLSIQENNASKLHNTGQNEGLKKGVQIQAEENNAPKLNSINTGQNEGLKNGVQIQAEENNAPKLNSPNTGQNEGIQIGVQISAGENIAPPLCVDIKADSSNN